MRTPFLAILALADISTGLHAQSTVVPNESATVSTGLLLNNLLRDQGQARSYMQGIAATSSAGCLSAR